MPIIKITKADLEKLGNWGNGWHKATFLEMKEDASKAKDSINYKPIFEYGWKSDGSNVEGKTLSEYACLMNSKNQAMFLRNFIPFASAILGKQIEGDTDVDLDKLKGSELWVEITPETYNGQMQERVTGFADKRHVPF